MDVANVIELIREKWVEFNNSRRLNFKNFVNPKNWRPKPGILGFRGVYVIFEGDIPIYVGSAGKGKHLLKYRIADLFNYTSGYKGREEDKFYHTLTRKLVEERIPNGLSLKDASTNFVQNRPNKTILEQTLDSVKDFYLKKCSFKVLKTNNIDEARMLEQVFLLLLNHPKYNG